VTAVLLVLVPPLILVVKVIYESVGFYSRYGEPKTNLGHRSQPLS
jgi:hypothetical protein